MQQGTVKLLVALDGSKLAEHSLAYVAAMRPFGLSEVEVVSVIEPTPIPARGNEDEERQRNLLRAYHEKVTQELHAETTIEAKSKLLTGPAPQALLNEVYAYQPDYLFISTHGASGLSRWRFGSVADKLIRGASCPTLVVGPAAAERESWFETRIMPVFDSILVPLDGSELAERALPEAERFAQAVGAQVHVVTAVQATYMGPNEAWAGVSPQLVENFTKDAQDYLEQVKAKTPGLGNAVFEVRMGPAAQALSDYVTEKSIDLIIMTSHGRGGFLRTALGSTTDRLLGGPAPVLIVRAADA